jgi:hypothetical protein
MAWDQSVGSGGTDDIAYIRSIHAVELLFVWIEMLLAVNNRFLAAS